MQETVNQASGALQKNQNGADIPDKDRFLSNINVYSKGEVDKKKECGSTHLMRRLMQ
ncbi:putative side tail fiber of prophage domain protein, partial [Escherichia coli DEC13D]